jgi:hypothetical protein
MKPFNSKKWSRRISEKIQDLTDSLYIKMDAADWDNSSLNVGDSQQQEMEQKNIRKTPRLNRFIVHIDGCR